MGGDGGKSNEERKGKSLVECSESGGNDFEMRRDIEEDRQERLRM